MHQGFQEAIKTSVRTVHSAISAAEEVIWLTIARRRRVAGAKDRAGLTYQDKNRVKV